MLKSSPVFNDKFVVNESVVAKGKSSCQSVA